MFGTLFRDGVAHVAEQSSARQAVTCKGCCRGYWLEAYGLKLKAVPTSISLP